MQRIAVLLTSTFLFVFSAQVVLAENAVKTDMKMMGKSFIALNKAGDISILKKELISLREATLLAQRDSSDYLSGQPMESAKRKLYAEGIVKLLGQIDASLALADAGKFAEAKASLANLKETQVTYHKQLKR